MSASVWNGAQDTVTIASGGTNSTAFSMPDNALGVLIFFPTMTNSSKIQALQPKDGDQDADSWADLSTILTGAGAVTISTVSGLASASAYGFDAGVLGSGVFRIVSGGAEGAGRSIRISWRLDRNRH